MSCTTTFGLSMTLKLNRRTGLNSLIQTDILPWQTPAPLEPGFAKLFRDLQLCMYFGVGMILSFLFVIYKQKNYITISVKRRCCWPSLHVISFQLKRKMPYRPVTVLITLEDHRLNSVVWKSRELEKNLSTCCAYTNSESDGLAWSIQVHAIEKPCVATHPGWCTDYCSSLLF